ncbi:MAG TPA: MBL fold metallo-hydrolase [Sphingobacteriaceae bacterium]|nr:MBL fold metallo-hydrolase [Sphingobacteriaceae bacterium]
MSLFITSLNSGSNGNCYYIGNETEAVLVDVGISCREAEKRMSRIGLHMKNVRAIFVSHEHTDHISGIAVMAGKYQIPVYITHKTLNNSALTLENHLVRYLNGCEPVTIGGLSITAFPKLHDATEPVSFMVSGNDVNVGVFTDIGTPCDQLIRYFKQCHAAFLEANYDEDLLNNGKYPYFLKSRIRGGKGHLSNKQALSVFTLHKPSWMSHLLLSHLSKDNNCPDLVHELFSAHAGATKIIVASRYEETPLFAISNIPAIKIKLKPAPSSLRSAQLQFVFN